MIINTIWVSFLSTLIIFFTLYSIFSKKVKDKEDDGNIYDSFKSKPRKKYSLRSRKVKKTPEIKEKKTINPPKKSTTKKKSTTPKKKSKPIPKVKKEEIVKRSTVKESKPKSKPTPKKEIKISEKVSKSKPKTKSKPKPSPKSNPKVKVKERIKNKPKSDTKPKPKPKNEKKGLEFKGQFDDKEVEFLKKYAIKNRGFVTQKLNDKVATKRWLKTKRSYDMLMDEVNNKKDKNGSYKTYVIWNNKVDKYLLKSKIK